MEPRVQCHELHPGKWFMCQLHEVWESVSTHVLQFIQTVYCCTFRFNNLMCAHISWASINLGTHTWQIFSQHTNHRHSLPIMHAGVQCWSRQAIWLPLIVAKIAILKQKTILNAYANSHSCLLPALACISNVMFQYEYWGTLVNIQ